MSGHDSKYFSTTKKGEIPELKEELNSQYKVFPRLIFSFHDVTFYALFLEFCSSRPQSPEMYTDLFVFSSKSVLALSIFV